VNEAHQFTLSIYTADRPIVVWINFFVFNGVFVTGNFEKEFRMNCFSFRMGFGKVTSGSRRMRALWKINWKWYLEWKAKRVISDAMEFWWWNWSKIQQKNCFDGWIEQRVIQIFDEKHRPWTCVSIWQRKWNNWKLFNDSFCDEKHAGIPENFTNNEIPMKIPLNFQWKVI
jgi:hypothetical protein